MDDTEGKDGTLGAQFLRHDDSAGKPAAALPDVADAAATSATSFPIGVPLGDAANPMEHDSAVYRTLLESTKAIPWKIDWRTMTFAYIGPQIETLLGWTPSSWVSVQDWVDRMHPDDREQVVAFCVGQSQAGVDHEADYRALTSTGDFVWLRDVVHVVRDEKGDVEALVGFMFDISERKKTEERLARLQRELEELSYKDALTGPAIAGCSTRSFRKPGKAGCRAVAHCR